MKILARRRVREIYKSRCDDLNDLIDADKIDLDNAIDDYKSDPGNDNGV